MTTMTEPTTHTLEVDGATLTYDVREAASPAAVLFLIGSPMGAGGFGTLASHFTDRTVVTYDPRGVERSTKADPTSESTPEQHADDLHRIIDRARRGAGRRLRQQRRRGQRARTRRRRTRTMSGRSSRTSRPLRRSCPTARARLRPAARSTTPTSRAASVPAWRGSSVS